MRFSIRFVHVNSNSPFRFDIFDSFDGLYNSIFMCVISAHYKFVEMPDTMECTIHEYTQMETTRAPQT